MKKTPSVHRLSIIAVMGIILLSGCLGRSPSTRFYALTPMPQGQATSLTEIPGRNPSVGIGPVKLADYLDQSKLVTRTGENRVDVADYDQWAGSLGDNFSNVLAENIGPGEVEPRDRSGDSGGGPEATREINCRAGMSLMMTDLAAGPETRSDGDCAIVTSELGQISPDNLAEVFTAPRLADRGTSPPAHKRSRSI
jgi:hypothetical protein